MDRCSTVNHGGVMRTPFPLLWLLLLVLPPPLAAQSVTSVRIPASALESYVRPSPCTVETKPISLRAGLSNVDTLHVRIENDQNKPSEAPVTLSLSVPGLISDSLLKGASSATLAVNTGGKLAGRGLEITRDSVPVCFTVLPALEVAEDTVRRAFRVGLGATFDFLSGLSATDLYYDLTIFLPDIWNGTVGIDAGMYSGRTAAIRDTIMGAPRLFFLRRPAGDSLTKIEQSIDRRNDLTFDKLGLYLAPTLLLTKNLHLVMHAEVIRQETIRESSITVLAADTTAIPNDTSLAITFPPDFRVPLDVVVTRRFTDFGSFFGTGIIVSVTKGDILFRAKPLIGIERTGDNYIASYVIQFRVVDFDNGFKIGGDVRGGLNGRRTNLLVYLAKDVSFKRLADFIIGGDDDVP